MAERVVGQVQQGRARGGLSNFSGVFATVCVKVLRCNCISLQV